VKHLKVYGYIGSRGECPAAPNRGKQTREIVAAYSFAAATRAVLAQSSGWSTYSLRQFMDETGNNEELEVAITKPGTVFWRPLDHHGEIKWLRFREVKKGSL